jgi:hypothetical protein
MATTNAFANQIQNRNYLSPIGFKFTLAKEPKVTFFCNSAKIPEINAPTLVQPSYLKDLDVPGTKLIFGDLTIRFLVDENMENYMAIHNWLTGLGFPESAQQYRDFIAPGDGEIDRNIDILNSYSDGSLHILNSNYNPTATVKFKDLFPVSLSSLDFDSTSQDIQYFTADATFKYTVYNILGTDGKPL